MAGEGSLGLKERVEVVEERVRRIAGLPWSAGEERVAPSERAPVILDRGRRPPIAAGQRHREIRPRAPVCGRGLCLGGEQRRERLSRVDVAKRQFDSASSPGTAGKLIDQGGLPLDLGFQEFPGDLDSNGTEAGKRLSSA